MNSRILTVALLATAVSASAQTATHKSTTAAKPHTATAAHTATTAKSPAPANLPAVITPVQTLIALRYQEMKVGTGALADPGKIYSFYYTGWRTADGVKFDSSYDHREPIHDKDGKPVLDADGKPKLGDPQPLKFFQGAGRLIPGMDQAFGGMHVGGKRRVFVPWQLGYGTRSIPDNDPTHPGIPAKSDLIFDIELISIDDVPPPPAPNMPPPAPTDEPKK